MKILPKKVAYWPHLKVGNPVLYIRELKYADEYITYTNKFINEVHATFNFPLKTIPGGDTIYILGYQKDSNLVEFFSPDYHNKIYGFSTGYLHKSLVHDSLRKE